MVPKIPDNFLFLLPSTTTITDHCQTLAIAIKLEYDGSEIDEGKIKFDMGKIELASKSAKDKATFTKPPRP